MNLSQASPDPSFCDKSLFRGKNAQAVCAKTGFASGCSVCYKMVLEAWRINTENGAGKVVQPRT